MQVLVCDICSHLDHTRNLAFKKCRECQSDLCDACDVSSDFTGLCYNCSRKPAPILTPSLQ
jgi:hypothetical protein